MPKGAPTDRGSPGIHTGSSRMRQTGPLAHAVSANRPAPACVRALCSRLHRRCDNAALSSRVPARSVRSYCGHALPDGMRKNDALAEPLVTPTTKAEDHDEPVTPAQIVERGLMSAAEWEEVSACALALFRFGQREAAARGLLLVDTKYEFGRCVATGRIALLDEVHTPDSSRYWVAGTYAARHSAGEEPENIDKEFLRLWFAKRCDPYADAKLPGTRNRRSLGSGEETGQRTRRPCWRDRTRARTLPRRTRPSGCAPQTRRPSWSPSCRGATSSCTRRSQGSASSRPARSCAAARRCRRPWTSAYAR